MLRADQTPYRRRTPAVVPRLLAEYGQHTRESMLRFLPDWEPKRYLYDLVADYPRRGGRQMRSTLCIATACAHGATREQALDCAISIELLHNALLVIDDIQDGSEERRGQPSLHEKFNLPLALNAGSALTVMSLAPLLNVASTSGPLVALRIFRCAVSAAQACAEGQAMELGWRYDNRIDVTDPEYLNMVLRKTCSYTTLYPLAAGALVGTRGGEPDPALLRYGFLLGAAFQIQDDILNLEGEHAQYGKELAGDLWEGKRTLITSALLRRCSPDERRTVVRVLGQERREKAPDQVRELLEWIRKYECVEHARRCCQSLLGAAEVELSRYASRLRASQDRDFLFGLIPWVTEQTS